VLLHGGTGWAARYQLVDLGTLPGGDYSFATALEQGAMPRVAGYADTASHEQHAFLYDPAQRPPHLSDLKTLGGTTSQARGVNASRVVGFSSTGTSSASRGATRAFVEAGGRMTSLGTLAHVGDSHAWAINRHDVIVGDSSLGNGDMHAVVVDATGKMADLGTLGGRVSWATAVNDRGVIAGSSYLAGESGPHAFVYANGKMADLGTLARRTSYANAINGQGDVAGGSLVRGTVPGTFFMHAFVYRHGAMTDLHTLGGDSSNAYGINEAGQVVGESTTPSADTHAFICEASGAMTDLNTLVSAPGWTLQSATAINDAGAIVGYGTVKGRLHPHAFLLLP
jgi:probable HAF family extracellular repeat protein